MAQTEPGCLQAECAISDSIYLANSINSKVVLFYLNLFHLGRK